jgi:hypothetical protein
MESAAHPCPGKTTEVIITCLDRPSTMREEEPITMVGVYTQPYNRIVRPERVWKISKYFLRRWTPHLSPSEVWLVIGARQLSYFNEKRPWFKAYDRALSEAAGVHVKVFRRTIKKDITDGEGHIATFLSKEGDPAYRRQDGVTKQTQTRYTVRLDDPLTPGDAAALTHWLRRNAPQRVTPQGIVQLLVEASGLPAKKVRADDPASIPPEAPGLLSVADVVTHVFPTVSGSKSWRETADALHTTIVAPDLAHFETQYFRRRWVPELGPGPALLLTYLRSLCYHNEESGEVRDEIVVESGQLEAVFQISSRTLRRWFSKLEKAVSEDNLLGPFYRTVDAVKQSNQKVATTYWINLKTPLTPAGLDEYRERLLADGHDPERVMDEKFLTLAGGHGQKVTHTSQGRRQKVGHRNQGDRQKAPHTTPPGGQEVPHRGQGKGQKMPGRGTKGGAYKYYKRLLPLLGIPSFKDLWEIIPEQQQDVWHVHDEKAKRTFAAVAAEGQLEKLLVDLAVQEPSFSQIMQQQPSLEEVMAWRLYAFQEVGLNQPLSYVIKRLLAGDAPPLHFLQLSSLSWEQWRSYALAWHHRQRLGRENPDFQRCPLFEEWGSVFGSVPLQELPCGVGDGLAVLYARRGAGPDRPSSGEDAAPVSPDETGPDVEPPEPALWQATLEELSLQMTQATFDAWLRQTRFLRREGTEWVIGVDSLAAQAWLENRLCDVIRRTLSGVLGEEVQVRFEDTGE